MLTLERWVFWRVWRALGVEDMDEIPLFVLCPHSVDLLAIKEELGIVVDCGFVEDVLEHASDEVFLFDTERSVVEVLDDNHVLLAHYHDVNVDFRNPHVGGAVVFEMMGEFLVIHDNRGHVCVPWCFGSFSVCRFYRLDLVREFPRPACANSCEEKYNKNSRTSLVPQI